MTQKAIMLILLMLGILALLLSMRRRGGRHARYRWRAGEAWKTLSRDRRSAGETLTYLRKTNPYVFEEMVLDAFERNGYKAMRNSRYSGDGGVDGRVRKDGKTYLVQCKRYKGFVDAGDVERFAHLCRESGMDGFFVHTGKTGRKSKLNASYGNVKIVSGNKLIGLFYETLYS